MQSNANFNLNKSQLGNYNLETFATDPSPWVGRFYLNTTDNTVRYFNGTSWKRMDVTYLPGTAGYTLGNGGDALGSTQIEKMLFSNESIALAVGSLSVGSAHNGGASDMAGGKGYRLGGTVDNVANSTADRLMFATDTASRISATLAGVSYGNDACYSSTAGYTGPYSAQCTKLTFSSESLAFINNYANSANQRGGLESDLAGYMAGGYPGSNTVNRITFNSDAVAAISAVMPYSTPNFIGVSNKVGNVGYYGGGYGSYTTISKLNFSTEVIATLSSTLIAVGYLSQNGYYSRNIGYMGSGQNASKQINKLNYTSEAVSLATSVTIGNRYNNATLENLN